MRSCTGPNGAPAEHCREVWGCGGLTQIGSPSAWNWFQRMAAEQTTDCEIARVNIHPGYLDAYEVSVARFRAWVRAGMPQPPFGQRLFLDPAATWSTVRFDVPNYSCRTETDCTRPDPERCTYSDIPGVNDERPVNCIDGNAAAAFCFWEGKHLANEGLWEYFATNRGRTALPFSNRIAGPFDPCQYGDVAGCDRTAQLPLAINARPLGQSADPAGVFGLWGGLREVTFSLGSRFSRCITDLQDDDHWGNVASLRGRSYRDVGATATQFDHSATKWLFIHSEDRDPGVGFRCARWVPEPWE
jgi:formylglycine-generating enzyme required for sulfatase activity